MRKITDFKGDEACEFLCKIIDPMQNIAKDKDFLGLMKVGKPLEAAKRALNEHKESALEIVCAFKGVELNEKDSITPVDFLSAAISILNDNGILQLFTSQE